MFKVIGGIFLFVLSIALLAILAPVGLLFTVIKAIEQQAKSDTKFVGLAYMASSLKDNALSLDIFGNVICKDLLTPILLKEENEQHIPFGNVRMSVSGVIGLNAEQDTLSFIGRGLKWLLDIIDKGHAAKAAENNRPYLT